VGNEITERATMTEKSSSEMPEIFRDFEKYVSNLMIASAQYAASISKTTQEDVKKAINDLYGLFYSVVEDASYMQETIKKIHEIEEGK